MATDYISQDVAVTIADYAADKHPYDKDTKKPETYSEYNRGWNDACDYIRDRLEREKPADVEPVVSCKGCEHAERYERTDGTAGYYCGHPQNTFVFGDRWDRVFKPVKKPDDFCSYGERRTNQSADVRNMEGGNEHECAR